MQQPLLSIALIVTSCCLHVEDAIMHGDRVRKTMTSWTDGDRRASDSGGSQTRRPNIILFILDDLDAELGSLNYMPETLRLLRDEGASFDNAYSTAPVCCPSRSSMLTGMYPHNTQIRTNSANCSGETWQRGPERHTFGVHLQNHGYNTAYVGKYLNQYRSARVPPGWSHWVANTRNTVYYNYTLVVNGRKEQHGDDYHRDYFTDVITNHSVSFLSDSFAKQPSRPIAMVMSFPAPHGRQVAAPQYQHMFQNVTSHRTGSWNNAPNPDKQAMLRDLSAMTENQQQFTDWLNMKRLQTLPSVDDAVRRIINALEQYDQLDNTYLVFTSDHGFHLGQFGLVEGKSTSFEFDSKVPFLIRGPGIPSGIRISEIVLNIDICPTFLDIAGIPIPPDMDGLSIMELFSTQTSQVEEQLWRDSFVVEQGKQKERHSIKHILRKQLEELADNQEHPTPALEVKGSRGETIDGDICSAQGTECKVITSEHWSVPPYWTGTPVCICTESHGISFICLRTINSTQNVVFCQFNDGFRSYYDLHTDPYQLQNLIDTIDSARLQTLNDQLHYFSSCRGAEECRRHKEGISGTTRKTH